MESQMRRGQGSMEYLVNYGWAILVVIVIGIALWQVGIFSQSQGSITATGFAKLKPQTSAVKLTEDGTFSGMFTNGAGTSITDLSANITNRMTGDSFAITNSTSSFGAGALFQVQTPPGALGTQGSRGDTYEVAVIIGYNVTLGGQTSRHYENGIIRGQLEPA